MRDKQEILISKMTKRHKNNTIRMLKRSINNGFYRAESEERENITKEWLDLMLE